LQAEKIGGLVECSVHFVDVVTMRQFNSRWLGKDEVTNVLAFPLQTNRKGSPDPDGVLRLGEIFVAPHARIPGAPRDPAHLVLHGFLHLLGWQDHTTLAAARMDRRVRKLLRQCLPRK
jgi:probable rRNA maturation factor